MVIIIIKIILTVAITIAVIFSIAKLFNLSKPDYKKIETAEQIYINKIRENDPAFDAVDFKIEAVACLDRIYDCLINFDGTTLMAMESESFYRIHNEKILIGKQTGQAMFPTLQEVGKLKITSYRIDGNKEIIGCGIWLTEGKFKVNAQNSNIISYDNTPYTRKKYIEFIRTNGVKTIKGKMFASKNCPACGAQIATTNQGTCSYCNNVLINGEHSWVVNNLEEFVMSL